MASTSWCQWEIIDWQEGVAGLDRKERSAWKMQMVLCAGWAEVIGMAWVSVVYPVAFFTHHLQLQWGNPGINPLLVTSVSHTVLIILTLSSVLSFQTRTLWVSCTWKLWDTELSDTANAVPAPMLCVLHLPYAHIAILDTGVYYLPMNQFLNCFSFWTIS